MTQETDQPTNVDAMETPKTPQSTDAHAADRAEPRRTRMRKSTIAMGGAALIALGVLLGIGAAHYAAGVHVAAAATKSPNTRTPVAGASRSTDPNPEQWSPFQEIRDMRVQMDQLFDQMTADFRLEPRLSVFPDVPRYSLSLRLKDLKDHYEVRARLPDAAASNVKVNLVDNQRLDVEVSDKSVKTPKNASSGADLTEWGQYAQVIDLPTRVKSAQMEINQAKHELLVTLPKA